MDKNYVLLGQWYLILQHSNCREVDELKVILEESGYDLNYQIPRDSLIVKRKPQRLGYTLLHFAVEHNKQELIKLLLSLGADFTLKAGNDGFTPLRLAVEMKKNSKQIKLTTRIYDLPIYDTHLTITIRGVPEVEPLLSIHLKTNNSTNPKSDDGISHFHIACLANCVPLARLFLQAGVSVNERVNATSDLFPGFSPMHFAVRYGDKDLVKLLLNYGADLNLVDGNGRTPLRLLVERSIEINDCLSLGVQSYEVPEIEQEFQRNDMLIACLLESILGNCEYNSCPQTVVDDIGLSVLHVSCAMRDSIRAETFDLISNRVLDINCKVNLDSPAWPAYSPLHFAAFNNNIKIFMLLLAKGADILAKDANGVTPLDLFVQRHKLTYVCDVLNSLPTTLGCVRFESGARLVDVIDSMKLVSDFERFAGKVNVNTRLPENSILWPGYTLGHLVVALSKVTYKFRRDSFVKNNNDANENYDNSVDDDKLVKTCLKYKPNLTTRNADGMTLLHLAFRLRKKNIVDRILEEILSSDNVENCVDREGLSHLQIACIIDNVKLVSKFLERGFDPNSPTQVDLKWRSSRTYKAGSTLYHIAAANSSYDMIKAISRFGARMNLLDADGLTALHVCFFSNLHLHRCVTELRNFTDKIYVDLEKLNCRNKLKILLSLWMSQETTTNNYTANLSQFGRLSYLHLACFACDPVAIQKLVSVTANVETPIDYGTSTNTNYPTPYGGWTPLLLAVEAATAMREQTIVAVMFLLSFGLLNGYETTVDVVEWLHSELRAKGDRCFGLTKLHLACILKKNYKIESLLRNGEDDINGQIDENSPLRPGDTALHILINSSETIIKLLLKHGADITLKNADNCTPLHLLLQMHDDDDDDDDEEEEEEKEKVLDIILKAGSHFYEANPSNDDGLSHFHISCMYGNVDIVKNFIDSGVDINEIVCPFASKYPGCSPLHLAVRYKNKEIVKLLLHRGANFMLEDSKGITPIQQAGLKSDLTMIPVIFSNARMNIETKTLLGQGLFEVLLHKSYEKSSFQTLLDNGVRINFIDPPAKKKYIASTAWMLENDMFRAFVDRATDVTNIDGNGKNVVHSIASLDDRHSSDFRHRSNCIEQCALNVKLWLDKGCDLNFRDKLGRTPLHDAVASTNPIAVKILLILGADVNIRDNHGQTALSYLNEERSFSIIDFYLFEKKVRRLLLEHILFISCCGLHLDASLDDVVRNEYPDDSKARTNCQSNLTRMTKISITEDLALRDLLTEKVVGDFPCFPESKRKIILEFLRPERLLKNYGEWKDWNNLFALQYWKILQRTKQLESVVVSFSNSETDPHQRKRSRSSSLTSQNSNAKQACSSVSPSDS